MATTRDLAPRLRHRIDIEEIVSDIDSDTGLAGEPVWVTIRGSDEPDLFPAEVVPASGREFIAAQAAQSGVTTRITIRRRDGLRATSMRALHDGNVHNILAVLPDPTFRHYVTLMCDSGVNDG